jgi:hypothetical protein
MLRSTFLASTSALGGAVVVRSIGELTGSGAIRVYAADQQPAHLHQFRYGA